MYNKINHPAGFSKSAALLSEELGISKSRLIAMTSGIEKDGRVIRRSKMLEGKHYKAERDREGKVLRYWFSDRIRVLRGRVWLSGEREEEHERQVDLFVEEVEQEGSKPL